MGRNAFSILLFLAASFAAAPLHAEPVVHLRKFELKNDAGAWVSVIEPDRLVDLAEEQAKVSFFNTTGRVPEGRYVNFRLTLADDTRTNAVFSVTRAADFAEPLAIRKGSFLFADVEPVLETPVRRITEARLTVDERELAMGPEEIRIES